MRTLSEALDAVDALQGRGWRLGLDRMREAVERVGLTDFVAGREGCRFFHVAGTNGKGSVTAMIESALVADGRTTGGFFSPFVVDPLERVQIGGRPIPAEQFVALVERLLPLVKPQGITEFEFKTLLGFAAWREAGCTDVALEVGLGGRLDATNVVAPVVSVIVSIGRDHEAILGHRLGEIAWEKAGILKPGVPAVVGDLTPEALAAVERVAERVGAPLLRRGREVRPDPNLRPGLAGRWQRHNAALAAAALRIGGVSEAAIQRGIAEARPPGRFQVETIRGATVVFDGAHNAPAGEALAETLAERFPGRPVTLVTNMLDGHDPLAFYRALPTPRRTFVAPIAFFRAVPPERTVERLAEIGWSPETAPSAGDALDRAVDAAGDGIVLVTGSNYLVGAAINAWRTAR